MTNSRPSRPSGDWDRTRPAAPLTEEEWHAKVDGLHPTQQIELTATAMLVDLYRADPQTVPEDLALDLIRTSLAFLRLELLRGLCTDIMKHDPSRASKIIVALYIKITEKGAAHVDAAERAWDAVTGFAAAEETTSELLKKVKKP